MTTFSLAVCKGGCVVSTYVGDATARTEFPGGKRWGPLAIELSHVALPNMCPTCGLPVLTACESCKAPIAATDVLRGVMPPPSFCGNCGEPYPWTSREQRIARLKALLDLEPNLPPANRLELVEQIDVLAQPVSRQNVQSEKRAVEALKRLAPVAWQQMQPILASLASAELQQLLTRVR